MKKKVFIDFDDTLVQSSKRIVEMLNKKYNTNVNIKSSKLYDLSDIFPQLKENELFQLFEEEEFFNKNLKKSRNAEKTLLKMQKYFDYYIVTLGTEKNLKLKKEWCKNNLNFKYEFIGLTNFNNKKKEIDMKNGIFIDDKLDILESSNSLFKILYIGYLHRDTNDIKKLKKRGSVIPITNWDFVYKVMKVIVNMLDLQGEKDEKNYINFRKSWKWKRYFSKRNKKIS